MESLKPKLFEVLHNYSKEQLIKDIISGIIVAIIALPFSIALAIASGVGPEQGLYTAIIAGFLYFFFRREPCTDWRTDCCICCYHLWHCCQLWNRRTDRRNHPRRHHFCHHGHLPFWFSDQIHSLYDHNRIYLWYRCHPVCRTAQRFSSVLDMGAVPSEFLNKVICLCCKYHVPINLTATLPSVF